MKAEVREGLKPAAGNVPNSVQSPSASPPNAWRAHNGLTSWRNPASTQAANFHREGRINPSCAQRAPFVDRIAVAVWYGVCWLPSTLVFRPHCIGTQPGSKVRRRVKVAAHLMTAAAATRSLSTLRGARELSAPPPDHAAVNADAADVASIWQVRGSESQKSVPWVAPGRPPGRASALRPGTPSLTSKSVPRAYRMLMTALASPRTGEDDR